VIRLSSIWRRGLIWLLIGIRGRILGPRRRSQLCRRLRQSPRRCMRRRRPPMRLRWIALLLSSRKGCNLQGCFTWDIKSTIYKQRGNHSNKKPYSEVITAWIERILPLRISAYQIERVITVIYTLLVKIVRIILKILKRFKNKSWSNLNYIF
jgi:hypothetical protein